VQDVSNISISGIESSQYADKVKPASTPYTSPAEALTVSSKIDRVYTPAAGPEGPVIVTENGKKKFTVVRDNMNEVVVWNPWKEDAEGISDFAPKDGYKQMICVEAGAVKGWVELGGGETWEGGQVITY
jgi:glucose-6-phosphate 1-epimerase